MVAEHPFSGDRSRLKEVVLGLHWDPPPGAGGHGAADLDALCVLRGENGEVREVVHPGNTRSSDGSVVHTGDSRTGRSNWDDERIFVFLEPLPASVAALAFIVASASRHPFDQVPGAVCHVSDRTSETEWVRIDLTALAGCTHCVVARLHRDSSGWRLQSGPDIERAAVPLEVLGLLEGSKRTTA